MTFQSGNDFLLAIKEYGSFYNANLEVYVFHYNEDGAIAVYNITPEYADKLGCMAIMEKCPWHALLGFGGYIYDTKDSIYYDGNNPSCEDWCSQFFEKGDWEIVRCS